MKPTTRRAYKVMATIKSTVRYPTQKLAEATIPFLPNCGWEAVPAAPGERGGFYLQFLCDAARAPRLLALVRAAYPSAEFKMAVLTDKVAAS